MEVVRKPYVHKQKQHFRNHKLAGYGIDHVRKPYLHKIKTELEKMLVREKRMDIFKKCLDFLDTRVALDQNGFKFDIFEH